MKEDPTPNYRVQKPIKCCATCPSHFINPVGEFCCLLKQQKGKIGIVFGVVDYFGICDKHPG